MSSSELSTASAEHLKFLRPPTVTKIVTFFTSTTSSFNYIEVAALSEMLLSPITVIISSLARTKRPMRRAQEVQPDFYAP